MDAHDFDRLTRAIPTRLPRRTLAGLLGLSSLSVVGPSTARKTKKKKKKVKRNGFNCVDAGNSCKNDGQCCSGICEGKKKKRKCKAHDESTCQPGQDSCIAEPTPCATTAGFIGQCVTTTGKVPYCFADADCFPCSKDADCEPAFGAGAACIVCSAECSVANPRGTACAGLAAAL